MEIEILDHHTLARTDMDTHIYIYSCIPNKCTFSHVYMCMWTSSFRTRMHVSMHTSYTNILKKLQVLAWAQSHAHSDTPRTSTLLPTHTRTRAHTHTHTPIQTNIVCQYELFTHKDPHPNQQAPLSNLYPSWKKLNLRESQKTVLAITSSSVNKLCTESADMEPDLRLETREATFWKCEQKTEMEERKESRGPPPFSIKRQSKRGSANKSIFTRL